MVVTVYTYFTVYKRLTCTQVAMCHLYADHTRCTLQCGRIHGSAQSDCRRVGHTTTLCHSNASWLVHDSPDMGLPIAYVCRSYTCSTLHSFCSCAATPQVLLGKHIEFPWLPIVVGFVSVFITIVSHQTSFEYRKPNILFICRHACVALDLSQANQTRHKGLRGKDVGVKIHPLTSIEWGVVELTCQSAIPATCHHLPYGLRRRIAAESF